MFAFFEETPHLSTLVLAGFASYVVFAWLASCIKSYRSPLSAFPGPWYAPFFTAPLQVAFSRGTVWKDVENAHAKYGPVVRLGPRQIWVADKWAVKEILLKQDLPKVVMYSEISREKESAGLFGEVRPAVHKNLKKLLSPSFTVGYVDGLDPLFQKPVRDILDVYMCREQQARESGQKSFQTNLMEDLHKVALEIMGECAFGRGFGSVAANSTPEPGIDEKAWKKIPDAIFDGLSRRYQLVYFKRAFRLFGIHFTFDWPREMITAIESVMSRRTKDKDETRHDLLQHLIDNGKRPDNGKVMSARDIIDQMAELLLAGSETTSGTLAYDMTLMSMPEFDHPADSPSYSCFFLEVARHPEVRAKLAASLPRLSLDAPLIDGKTVREDPQYEYLNACIKENLRLHPIASELGRRTLQEPANLNGVEVPPYTVVSASYRALHHNGDYWPQPQRFWPERFLAEDSPLNNNGAPKADSDAYYPFSAGKHSCVGINFAWHEMRVVLANLLSRMDVQEVAGQTVDFRQFITMQFAHGRWNTTMTPREESEVMLRKDSVI